jgi:protein-histidine pros-kinase
MLVLFVVLERQFQLREQLASMLQSENRRLDSLVHERTEDLSDLASYLTNVREDEKERLARELHDELGALLTAAKIESGRLAERLDDKASAACGQRLARLEEYLDRGIALKQRIIDDLRPPFLEEFGLVETLRILGDDFAQEGDESLIMALPEGKVELAPAATLALFRIAQEALTNVRKHARAKSVTLALETTPDGIRLEIVDDGVGISAKVLRAAQHGLKGMKHRVQMCAGAFSFSSRPGDGTRITVVIPAVAGENGMAPADAGKRMVGKDFDLDIPELAGRSARRYAGSASRASLPIVSGAGLAAL